MALLKALGRGHCWQHLLDTGVVADMAEREGISRATVSEAIRMALLSPDITQAAFEGTLPRTMSLERLLRNPFPLDWGRQREMIAGAVMGCEVLQQHSAFASYTGCPPAHKIAGLLE